MQGMKNFPWSSQETERLWTKEYLNLFEELSSRIHAYIGVYHIQIGKTRFPRNFIIPLCYVRNIDVKISFMYLLRYKNKYVIETL